MVAAAVVAAARCLVLDALAAEAVVALRERSIDSVLLKGPVTVHWLYADDPDQRGYCDVDLLVDPARFDDASAVLTELGMRERLTGLRPSEAERLYERAWLRAPGEMLELHRSFYGVKDTAAFWTLMRAHTRPLSVGGVTVDGPDETAAALVYALHAVQHGAHRAGSRKPLADLARALDIFAEATWRAAAELAAAVGAAGAFAIGLSLDPSGAALATRLGLTPLGDLEMWLRASGEQRVGDIQLARLLTAPDRLTTLRDALFPTPSLLAVKRPWVRRNAFLLGLGYALRLLRGVRGVPGAVAQVLESRSAKRAAAGRRRRLGPVVRSTVRFARRPSRAKAGAAWWTLRALRQARTALRETRPDLVRLPSVPPYDQTTLQALAGTVRRLLHLAGASCLEAGVVRQAWLAAAGHPVDLVVGIAGPLTTFRAHAWLAGDRGTTAFTELVRYPAAGGR